MLLGTPDIASLGNFVDVYDVVSKLQFFPFGQASIFDICSSRFDCAVHVDRVVSLAIGTRAFESVVLKGAFKEWR